MPRDLVPIHPVPAHPAPAAPVPTPHPRRDGHVLAVDVGGTAIKAEVLSPDLRTVLAAGAHTPTGDGHGALEAVTSLCHSMLAELPGAQRSQVRAVGLAVPGVVDTANGVARMSANLGWRGAQVAAPVAASVGLPVVLSHDVTAAGLAEWQHGAGRGVDDVLVVVIGTGIAAAVVAAGRLVTGGAGQAGELGHVVVRPDGPVCGCGQRGCLEAVASARAIALAYSAATGGPVAGAAEVHALLGVDPLADAAWQEATDALADGILTACALLAPSRVVIGGGLSRAGEALLEPIRRRLRDQARVPAVPEVVAAELGDRAGVVGAALAAWQHLGSQPEVAR